MINQEYKTIADFLGMKYAKERSFNNGEWTHSIKSLSRLEHDWNWLMAAVRRIVEICCDPENGELFESDYYSSILDTVPLAVIEDTYKVVLEFINYYNEQQVYD